MSSQILRPLAAISPGVPTGLAVLAAVVTAALHTHLGNPRLWAVVPALTAVGVVVWVRRPAMTPLSIQRFNRGVLLLPTAGPLLIHLSMSRVGLPLCLALATSKTARRLGGASIATGIVALLGAVSLFLLASPTAL